MLHPHQFKVNEAWIAFKLNEEPLHTKTDGEFNFLALIDAASCFLLCFVPLPLKQAELTQFESRKFLEDGYVHKHRWPKVRYLYHRVVWKNLQERMSKRMKAEG